MSYTVVDIETTAKTPWHRCDQCSGAELRVAGISTKAHTGKAARAKLHAVFVRPGIVVEQTLFDVRWALLDGAALGPRTEIHDLRTMAWLLDESQPLDLEHLMDRYCGESIRKPIRTKDRHAVWDCDVIPLPGLSGLIAMADVPIAELVRYNLDDLAEEARLYERLRALLDEEGLWELFLEREVPLSRSIVETEAAGLPFDGKRCEELRASVEQEADALGARLVEESGMPELNLGSPAQLSDLLFAPKGERVERRGALAIDDEDLPLLRDVPKAERVAWFNDGGALPEGFEVTSVGRLYVKGVWVGRGRGLKTAEHGFGSSKHWKEQGAEHKKPSTSSVSLVLSNPEDRWVGELVYWRELDKLAGSFLAKFPLYSNRGRLFGTINRCGTVTGRFSSAEPNLQNIPAHGTYGALVRSLFCGDLVLGDYAQLEQRIATHYSQDPVMLKAYTENVDLYGLAASILFGGEASKKHPQRGLMKTGMLGIQFGAGAGKLAQLIMIDDSAEIEFNVTGSGARAMVPGQVSPEMKARSKDLIAQLRTAFPDFFAWREDVVLRAIRDGEVVTLAGRRRRLSFPEGWERRRRRARQWYSQEEQQAGFLMERQAINTLCQGGAADVVGGAMTAARLEMPREVRTLVQVHDEMVWQRLRGWRSSSLPKLRELCENGHGFELSVPMLFEAQEAESWADKGAAGQNAHGLFVDRMKRNRSEGLQSRKASDLARSRRGGTSRSADFNKTGRALQIVRAQQAKKPRGKR